MWALTFRYDTQRPFRPLTIDSFVTVEPEMIEEMSLVLGPETRRKVEVKTGGIYGPFTFRSQVHIEQCSLYHQRECVRRNGEEV